MPQSRADQDPPSLAPQSSSTRDRQSPANYPPSPIPTTPAKASAPRQNLRTSKSPCTRLRSKEYCPLFSLPPFSSSFPSQLCKISRQMSLPHHILTSLLLLCRLRQFFLHLLRQILDPLDI